MASVDRLAIERALARTPSGAVVVDPRLLRRVIKRHRHLPGIGLQVPHARCYALRRDELVAIADAAELGPPMADLPEQVILLPRPSDEDQRGKKDAEVLGELWRAAFHAEIHLAMARRFDGDPLAEAVIRERIHRIGETEFDEVRLVLKSDDLLLPPHDDRETYAEFAAFYLELRHFAPRLLRQMFPTLRELGHVDAALGADVDVEAALERTRPEGAAPLPDRGSSGEAASEPTSGPTAPSSAPARVTPSQAEADRLLAGAGQARKKGNDVRAALLALGAAAVSPPDTEPAALAHARADLASLVARLGRALRLPEAGGAAGDPLARELSGSTSLLLSLARTGHRRGLVRHTPEARLLFDLQRAAIARERPVRAVDLVEVVLSLGRRKLVRPLPDAAEVRIVRDLRSAVKKLRAVRLPSADRRLLRKLLHHAHERAEDNVRDALRPKILAALDEVGLVPRDPAERVARHKLVAELCDQAAEDGFLGLGRLRDALSRNQLKLPSLSGPGELALGDPLLRADRRLSVLMDGVYRRGEIYLRGLQKLSSLAFGTSPGRVLTRYLILPIGAAYVVLEGFSHVLKLILRHHVHLLTPWSFAAVSLLIFGLIHSEAVRSGAMSVVHAVSWFFSALFVQIPRWIARLPVVRSVFGSHLARAFGRWVLKPGIVAAALWALSPMHTLAPQKSLASGLGLFAGLDFLMSSRTGLLVEEIALDWLSARFRTLRRRVLPGLVRLVADFFRAALELLERAIYTVDEHLRFREGQSVVVIALKAAFGLFWFFIAYLARFFVNLLIEPQINPIKHFPVVTVSHKIVLSMAPTLESALSSIVGEATARAILAPTLLMIPGVFGFLVWEFKENWKLYRETRPRELEPALIGHHGETMGALMKPGFHSGTLPKLYTKLRRAAKDGDASLPKHEETLHEVERAVRHFVERELCALLAEAGRFHAGVLRVRAVELGSNRVTIVLAPPEGAEARIAFEEQSGLVLAGMPAPGFLASLPDEERLIFENALGGLYHLAGVDVVREQLEAELAPGGAAAPSYDISSAGVVVWPGEGYRTEVVYPFRAGRVLAPVVRGEHPATPPVEIAEERILYRRQPITWQAWVEAWQAASADEGPIPRLVRGASLLPRPAERDYSAA